MLLSDFYYDLPPELIAQTPIPDRESSRLMVLPRCAGEVGHDVFSNISSHLRPGDLLVLNDTKVIPARLYATKDRMGAAEIEFFLLRRIEGDMWESLVKPGKKVKVGDRFTFAEGLMRAEVKDIIDGGIRLVEFEYDGEFYALLDRIGETPLPHYITEKLPDSSRYQTVYAEHEGSAAAPTAGLHFTKRLLAELGEKGILTEFLTLHVGLGTFRPVKTENIIDHRMHAEYCELSADTATRINAAKEAGGRIIAVGTTSCRTLESAADSGGKLHEYRDFTDIFIYPGYEFKAIDGLITNFHLPESTLLMLVSALAGRERVLAAYEKAIAERYRFFSFGDAMLII